jgi:hypothetical protein
MRPDSLLPAWKAHAPRRDGEARGDGLWYLTTLLYASKRPQPHIRRARRSDASLDPDSAR